VGYPTPMPQTYNKTMPAPHEAIQRLTAGNLRFQAHGGTATRHAWSPDLANEGQTPFAVVLGCSDSRTPVEILFDQGFGELFVVRVAGNVVAPSIVGSVEFAVSQFGTRLVVVLGHTRCGAISATVQAIASGSPHESRNIQAITDRIAPHIHELVEGSSEGRHANSEFVRQAMHANVRASVAHLRHGSRLLEELRLSGQIDIVGAEYQIETGRVTFFD